MKNSSNSLTVVMSPEQRYLELLKSSLINALYLENEARLVYIFLSIASGEPINVHTVRDIEKINHPILKTLYEKRQEGRIQFRWEYTDQKTSQSKIVDLRNLTEVAHTMIGRKRLDNLHHCLDIIRQEDISGDILEAGVWRGGATVFMRGYLAAYNITNCKVWAADSFEGLPKPTLAADAGYDFSADKIPILAISLDEVRRLFEKYDLLDNQVQFIKGWFKDSLPQAPVEKLALLRVDGDLYESTYDALQFLYSKVVPNGFVIVDDYGDFKPCRQAVDEFRKKNDITTPINQIDWTGVYWRKEV